MHACMNGHVDTARMLLGEFHANVDNQDTVRIVRLVLCGDVRACVQWLCAWLGRWSLSRIFAHIWFPYLSP